MPNLPIRNRNNNSRKAGRSEVRDDTVQKSDRNLDFIFDKMTELLDKGGWQQNCTARDKNGDPVFVEDPGAVSFDLYGAFWRVFLIHTNMVPLRDRAIAALVKALNETVKPRSLSEFAKPMTWHHHVNKFNDTPQRTKMEILRLVERAKDAAS
jgi:hypothetical protein